MKKIVLSSFVAFILSSCGTVSSTGTGSSRPNYNGESSRPNYHSDRKHHRKRHSNDTVGGSGSYNGGTSGGSVGGSGSYNGGSSNGSTSSRPNYYN